MHKQLYIKDIVYNMYHRKSINNFTSICLHNDKPDHHSSFFFSLYFLLKPLKFGFAYQKRRNRGEVTNC